MCPQYREINNISWENANVNIKESLNDRINTWFNNHGAHKSVHKEWKHKIISKFDKKIDILNTKNTSA